MGRTRAVKRGSSLIRLHPRVGWDRYFSMLRARRLLALISLIWESQEWCQWNRSSKTFTVVEGGMGDDLRRRGGRRGLLIFFVKIGK